MAKKSHHQRKKSALGQIKSGWMAGKGRGEGEAPPAGPKLLAIQPPRGGETNGQPPPGLFLVFGFIRRYLRRTKKRNKGELNGLSELRDELGRRMWKKKKWMEKDGKGWMRRGKLDLKKKSRKGTKALSYPSLRNIRSSEEGHIQFRNGIERSQHSSESEERLILIE